MSIYLPSRTFTFSGGCVPKSDEFVAKTALSMVLSVLMRSPTSVLGLNADYNHDWGLKG